MRAKRWRCLVLSVSLGTLGFAGQTAMPTTALAVDGPIVDRHIDIGGRFGATQRPRTVEDQAVVRGWPMYRTDRGQRAFNDAMAALAATEGPAPNAVAFAGCEDLICRLDLPRIDSDGYVPPGRIWTGPNEYVLFVHSYRNGSKTNHRRRSARAMRYFIFHEFHNSTRNTDQYDTISSHNRSVFVPFYMGKTRTDAYGRKFVIVVQVAPYDVNSRHARNFGSAGPGIEVAKNSDEALQDMQAKGGILLATMLNRKAPRLKMVRHRGREGLASLRAYQNRLAALEKRSNPRRIRLPFVAAEASRVARAAVPYSRLIALDGVGAPTAAPAPAAIARTSTPAPTPVLRRVESPTQTAALRVGRVPQPRLMHVTVQPTIASLILQTAPSAGIDPLGVSNLGDGVTYGANAGSTTAATLNETPALALSAPPRRVTQRRCGLMQIFYPDIICRGS